MNKIGEHLQWSYFSVKMQGSYTTLLKKELLFWCYVNFMVFFEQLFDRIFCLNIFRYERVKKHSPGFLRANASDSL